MIRPFNRNFLDCPAAADVAEVLIRVKHQQKSVKKPACTADVIRNIGNFLKIALDHFWRKRYSTATWLAKARQKNMEGTAKPKGLAKIWREVKRPFKRSFKPIKKWFKIIKERWREQCSQRNYRRILINLKKKDTIKVVFLVSQCAKWNSDSLYQKLEADRRFSPVILYVPQLAYEQKDSNDEVECRFYRDRGYNFAAIFSSAELRAHKPDIVFYQQPWGNRKGDFAPVQVSQYALCLYFPYSIATTIDRKRVIDCFSFFKTLYRNFVFNTAVVEEFHAKGVHNTIATGHPKLDAYLTPVKTNPWKDQEKFKIIYAPHHSLVSFANSLLQWGTFDWNGRELLDWAKAHTDTEWIFKPHPRFRYFAMHSNIMNESELDAYYNEWNNIGSVYTLGDYFDIFRTADLLITDCGSFLTEWLPTEKPCIHLLSRRDGSNIRSFVHEASSRNYYKVKNLEELHAALDMLVIRREDPLAAARIQDAKAIPLDNAKNIHHWLIQTLCMTEGGVV